MAEKIFNSVTMKENCRFLPRKMEGLTPEMIQKARKELGETPERKQKALEELKDLIKDEEDFRPLMDDMFLLQFLRVRKFNVQAAMKNLTNYYSFKILYSRLSTDVLPSKMRHIIDSNLISCLPHRDQEGQLIGVGRLGHFDVNKFPLDDIHATTILHTEICLLSEATQICGAIFVIDLSGLTLLFARHLANPSRAYRILKGFQDCIPLRLKAVHILNEPFYCTLIYNCFKPFISQKLKDRLHFHGKNLDNFHEQVSPEILPREFGGHLGPMSNEGFGKEVLGAEEHILKYSTYGYGKTRADCIRRRNSLTNGFF